MPSSDEYDKLLDELPARIEDARKNRTERIVLGHREALWAHSWYVSSDVLSVPSPDPQSSRKRRWWGARHG